MLETTSNLRWESRPWGYFITVHSSPEVTVKRLRVHGGERLSLQKHEHRDEYWTLQSLPWDNGVEFFIGDELFTPQFDKRYEIPRGTLHAIINNATAPVEIIEVSIGDFDENDIVRIYDKYGRKS